MQMQILHIVVASTITAAAAAFGGSNSFGAGILELLAALVDVTNIVIITVNVTTTVTVFLLRPTESG